MKDYVKVLTLDAIVLRRHHPATSEAVCSSGLTCYSVRCCQLFQAFFIPNLSFLASMGNTGFRAAGSWVGGNSILPASHGLHRWGLLDVVIFKL